LRIVSSQKSFSIPCKSYFCQVDIDTQEDFDYAEYLKSVSTALDMINLNNCHLEYSRDV
jgi:hypothetical protein